MAAYNRVCSWLAHAGAAILVAWGLSVLARNFLDARLPGGEFGVFILIIVSFVLYELMLVNLSLAAGRMGRPILRRVFLGLAVAPPFLVGAVFVLNQWVSGRPAAAFVPVLALYFAYAVALTGAGLHLYRRVTESWYARIGGPLALAGAAYAIHALIGLIALAGGGETLPRLGFWLMLLGGASIAYAQFRLGLALRRTPIRESKPA